MKNLYKNTLTKKEYEDPANAQPLDWGEFLEFIKGLTINKFEFECFKSLSVLRFESGVLSVVGNAAAIEYLNNKERITMLHAWLATYVAMRGWDLRFEPKGNVKRINISETSFKTEKITIENVAETLRKALSALSDLNKS